MGLVTQFRQWQAARRARHIEKLTARATDINEDQEYDLLFLHKRGVVRTRATGQSITKIYANVENLIRKKLLVIVKPGTYFVASGDYQNMATTAEYTFTLFPCSTEQLEVNAVCINANRPIPGETARFVGVARVSDDLARFLEASRQTDPMVIQAGVWTLTDNYSSSDVKTRLISKDSRGNTWHPISDDHIDQAKAILNELGISHRLGQSNVPHENKTEKYDNGDTYIGEFIYGDRHGRGKYVWKDGDVYEGEWKVNKRTGEGIYTTEAGYKYVGTFKDGQQHGRGKATWASGNSYDGEWRNGKKRGEGIFSWKNGDKYVGKFEDDREIGGWYHHPNGSKEACYRNLAGQWVSSDKKNATDMPLKESKKEETKSSQTITYTHSYSRKYCPKCRTSDFYTQSKIELSRWKAGLCPRCEGNLVDYDKYWKNK